MVEEFALQDSRVAFIDVADEAAAQLIGALPGRQVRFLHCDLRDITMLRRTVAEIEKSFGGAVDVLVNNAARDDRQDFYDLSPEEWDECLNVNLRHQFFATQSVARGMAAQGGGSIILFGSTAWMTAVPGIVGYTTSKAAINGLTRTLARELGEQKIRVNCIVPGAILTERQEKLWLTPDLKPEISRTTSAEFQIARNRRRASSAVPCL
jgi:NAD(P)-dependent dehydrogenase (short-subunit alcohol dehydrogenase family)